MHGSWPRLMIIDAHGERLVNIDKPRFAIGRHPTADLKLTGKAISRVHAEIVRGKRACVLRDAKSRFGTFVNGKRTKKKTLSHGDQIEFGGHAGAMTIIFLDVGNAAGESTGNTARSTGFGLRQFAVLLLGLRALGSDRVVDDVLTLVLDAAIDVTGAERAFIMLANPNNQLEFKLARARGHVTLAGPAMAISRKIPETVFTSGEPSIIRDLADADLPQQHDGTIRLGIRHIVCVPLRLVRFVERSSDRQVHESPIGVLYLDGGRRGELHSASTLAAIDALSEEAALAIESARLYREALDNAKIDQELKVAAEIQRSLLPPANRDGPFFQAAGTSVPCRAVGGDFFDYVDLPDGRFGFIVGDVAGKGPPAALLATAALGMFSAESAYQTSTAALMTRLNQGMVRRAIEARYLTSFFGILAPNGQFLFCNAGHNAPLLVSHSRIRRLTTGVPSSASSIAYRLRKKP